MLDLGPKIIILFGRSGCGKGTQAKMLQDEFGYSYLGSGNILRTRAEQDDFSGRKLKKVLETGGRAPTYLMFSLWSLEVERIKKENEIFAGLIIDGSPRSLTEAGLMDQVFDWLEWKNVKVILLDISEDEAFRRLTKRRICKSCGRLIPWVEPFKSLKACDKCNGWLITRVDDKPAGVKARLEYFNKDVQPAIEYYKEKERLIVVNGDQSIEDVYLDIKNELQFK